MSDLNDLIDSLVEAGFSSTNAKELAPKLGGIGNAVIEDGVAKVNIAGATYALLPVDSGGNVVANIGLRNGTKAELLAALGGTAEIGLPTDANGFVVYKSGVGTFYPRLDNPGAAGAGSLAIGTGAITGQFADNALSLGNKARAQFRGEIAFGAGKVGIGKQVIMRHAVTTSAASYLVGNSETSSATFALPAQAALYNVRARVLVRDGYLNQWAQFERHAVIRVADDQSNAAVLNPVTPTGGDFNETLTGCAVSFIASAGPQFAVQINGLAGRTLNWAVFLDIETFTEEVLL